jgi:hypothetical protein
MCPSYPCPCAYREKTLWILLCVHAQIKRLILSFFFVLQPESITSCLAWNVKRAKTNMRHFIAWSADARRVIAFYTRVKCGTCQNRADYFLCSLSNFGLFVLIDASYVYTGCSKMVCKVENKTITYGYTCLQKVLEILSSNMWVLNSTSLTAINPWYQPRVKTTMMPTCERCRILTTYLL